MRVYYVTESHQKLLDLGLGVDIVRGWFTEGGDFILGVFFWQAFKREATRRLMSLLG